jgi:hypothetical protein
MTRFLIDSGGERFLSAASVPGVELYVWSGAFWVREADDDFVCCNRAGATEQRDLARADPQRLPPPASAARGWGPVARGAAGPERKLDYRALPAAPAFSTGHLLSAPVVRARPTTLWSVSGCVESDRIASAATGGRRTPPIRC